MKNKSRLIFIPQYPTKMRYTEWWIDLFEQQLSSYFSEVITLGYSYLYKNGKYEINEPDNIGSFNSLKNSIEFETYQIQEYIDLEIKNDDIILLADISFPGLFGNVLYHKRPKKCFAICHGTSKNNYDIFEKDRYSKWQVESGYAELFNKIIVASDYHRRKLKWLDTIVIPFPDPPMIYESNEKEKTIDIISVSRKCKQKIDDIIEEQIEDRYGPIYRNTYDNWGDYFDALSKAKILLITSKEETYGYQIIDCLKYGNGCIPIAPNQFSYPELLTEDYLYNRFDIMELYRKIDLILDNKFEHKLNFKSNDCFFKKLFEIID